MRGKAWIFCDSAKMEYYGALSGPPPHPFIILLNYFKHFYYREETPIGVQMGDFLRIAPGFQNARILGMALSHRF